ncbi:flagellar protein FlaG [uncultured Clostridium sp.]|uniref:flagellar protein FlaG n=1 Tax=uncultured Clostridium sp. TaxID=59620 RepID=UPI0025EDD87E|nr:flagellar protein FlaG [uncultured Clostridium sp.]
MDVKLTNNYQNYNYSYDNSNTITKDDSVNTNTNDSESLKIEDTDKNISNKDEKKKYTKEDLDKSIKKLNKVLEDEKTHAEYSKHKDLGTIMIKIIDDDSNKVIMELPPEKVLNMIAGLCKQVGILDEKA